MTDGRGVGKSQRAACLTTPLRVESAPRTPQRPHLLALGVVAGLGLARTALAARRSVPTHTTALAPDCRALENVSQQIVA